MRKRIRFRKNSRSGLILLTLIVHCFALTYFGLCWGPQIKKAIIKNIELKMYNNMISIYLPELSLTEKKQGNGIVSDIAGGVFPVMAYYETSMAYEIEDEDYELLAEDENNQLKQLLKENYAIEENRKDNKDKKDPEVKEQVVSAKEDEKKEKLDGDHKVIKISKKKLKSFEYLKKNFYQIDSTTTIGKDQLNVDKLMGVDMSIDDSVDGPQVLIYHTHSQEGYIKPKKGKMTTVVDLGDRLADILEKDYGYSVLHHKGEYDVNDRDHAYSKAAPAIEQIIKDNPSIQVVIDLHRDGVAETTHLVTEINGEKMAQIMFFNGLSRTTTQGDIASLRNPYIDENLALSFQLELAAKEYYPDFCRRTYLKGYRYNMHLCPKSILVEVGAQTNTSEEAMNSMPYLADVLAKVLKK